MPQQLGEALFGAGFPQQLEMCRIEKMFPKALKLTLNHLDKQQMITEREQLAHEVLALIATETKLMEVTIQSAPHERIQESSELKRIAGDAKINKELGAKGWSVAYTFQKEAETHRLVFSIDKDKKTKDLAHQREIEMQREIQTEKAEKAEMQREIETEKAEKEDLVRQLEMMKAQMAQMAQMQALRQKGNDSPTSK